jgi:hypothetical protein
MKLIISSAYSRRVRTNKNNKKRKLTVLFRAIGVIMLNPAKTVLFTSTGADSMLHRFAASFATFTEQRKIKNLHHCDGFWIG